MATQEIQVRVEHPAGTKFCCTECQKELSCHDHGEERRWRHLDSCQYKSIFIGRVPRVDCPEHGVKTVKKLGEGPRVFSSTGTLYRLTTNDDQTEIHFSRNQNQDPLLDKDQDPQRFSLIRIALPNPNCCMQKVPSRC